MRVSPAAVGTSARGAWPNEAHITRTLALLVTGPFLIAPSRTLPGRSLLRHFRLGRQLNDLEAQRVPAAPPCVLGGSREGVLHGRDPVRDVLVRAAGLAL